ncbi:MAG: RNA-binding protein [archaeon]|nr:RNA-binding protein [archaeon]
MQLKDLISEVDSALSEEEKAVDLAFTQSRKIIRKTKTAIHGIHIGQRDPELIDSISSDLAALVESLAGYPRLLYGNDVESAMMEFAETVLYDYSSRGEELPSYYDLDVTPCAWIMGLADCIGELRRDMLTELMNGRLDDATRLFTKMEELTDALMTFDIKDSVAPIRRKQDIARGIMDRSRTDIATAKIMKN